MARRACSSTLSSSYLGELALRQGVAILLFAVAVALVYRAALKRIHAHGG